MKYILTMDELEYHSNEVGAKAIHLVKLQSIGCNVPPFIVIPASVIQTLDKDSLDAAIAETIEILQGVSVFSVRSATLIEDGARQSYAGQFLTRLNVSKQDLAKAINEVIAHAEIRLGHTLSTCSLMIQEYIPADVSGVTFTRHPSGLRQMLIEYHKGIGEHLVSGTIRPISTQLFWTEPLPSHELPLATIVPLFERIEKTFGHPQDIEWCIRDQKVFFLQSRPITSIDSKQYQGIIYLDHQLPSGIPFLYQQTSICEIAPRPTPFTLSVLKRLYAKNGPIERVYRAYGVRYESKDFFRILGSQLYIDREVELHSLFPTHTYLKSPYSDTPAFNSLHRCVRSIKNLFAFAKMNIRDIRAYENRLKDLLEAIPSFTDISKIWSFFDHAYETIFEVNLFAEKFISRLESALKNHPASTISILSSSFRHQFFKPKLGVPSQSWIGNGLEISEQEPFIAKDPNYQKDDALDSWWNSLPEYQKKFLSPLITNAVAFDDLRERGRWLTVGCVNALKHSVNPWTPFITMNEYEQHVSDRSIENRKYEYAQYSEWNFPSFLTNLDTPATSKTLKGVSAGKAKGILITREQLDEHANESVILYSEMLTPDLAQLFPRIKGIISAQGGTLSHLAIIAREQHLPVVTHVDLSKQSFTYGDSIEIDGEKGIIKRYQAALR